MSWMRRAGAIVLAVALVVLIPAPAGAADLPSPVDPYPLLPSTNRAVFSSAGAIGDNTMSWAMQYALAMKNSQKAASAAGEVAEVVQPLTKAAPLSRLAGGTNLLVGGLTAGFAIGQAGVQLYATVTGNDPLPGVCGSGLEFVSSIMYIGMVPDCSAPFAANAINNDVTAIPAGWSANPTMTGTGPLAYGAGGNLSSWWVSVKTITAPNLGSTGTLTLGADGGTTGTVAPGWSGYAAGGSGFATGTQRQKIDGTWEDTLTSSVAPLVGTGGASFGSSFTTTFANGATYTLNSAYVPGSTYKGWRYFIRNGSQAAYWYPMGTPNRPAGQSGDPLRSASCKVTMSDGSVLNGFVGQYRESEGFPMGAVSAACTDAMGNAVAQGLLPETIELTSTNPDTGKTDTISTEKVPDFTESEKVGLTPGDNTGLRLLKVVNGVTQSCMTWEAECGAWWSKTSSGTTTATDTGTYRCEYGGREVALAECGVYRNTFDAKTETPKVTDPETGNEVQWSNTTDPANQFGTGAQSGQSSDRCVTSFSLNPVDWVLRPIRCAFEPRKSKVDGTMARIQAAWRLSMPGKFAATIGGVGAAFEGIGAGGCGGVIVPVPEVGAGGKPVTVNRAVLAACPGDFFAPWAPIFFWLISISICVGGFFIIKGQLDRFVNN